MLHYHKMNEEKNQQEQAVSLFKQAYKHQMKGELADAILLYKQSINRQPTAEAFTFLGWTYAMLQRYEEAIDACHQAIEIDPDFGNPYNDIGSYLIALEQWEEAIPWLEKAINAPHYEAPHYSHMNLGRVYEHLGAYQKAITCYDMALALEPMYIAAVHARNALIARFN